MARPEVVDRKLLGETELVSSQRSGLDVAAAWAAWLLPLVLCIAATPTAPGWESDLETLRDVGFVPVGTEGALSTLFSQLMLLVPVGGRVLRAAWVGSIALGVCSGLFFGIIRRRLDSERPSRLNGLWALLASQIWACSPVVLTESARVGQSALSLALVIGGLRLLDELADDARLWPLLGGLLGVTFAECHAAGFTLLGCSVLASALADRRGAERRLLELATALGITLLVFAGWRFMRMLSPALAFDLGLGLGVSPLAQTTHEPFALVPSALAVLRDWHERLGVVPLGLALAGTIWTGSRAGLRRALAPFALLVVLGALGPLLGVLGMGSAQPFLATLSSLALMAFAALALRALIHELWQRRVPLARPAAVLCTVFVVTLVLSRLEAREAPVVGRPSGAEVWTEEALGRLPADALVVVQSPPLALRLLAAREVYGERPDVVVVPTELLPAGSLQAVLSARYPELAPLLRQLAVSGFADEFSLSQLADLRPLFVELSPSWDRRLLEHMKPAGLWLGMAPHALGGLDRRAGAAEGRAALWRVVEPLAAEGGLDPATRSALALLGAEQALLLAAFGERSDARKMLHIRNKLTEQDALAIELAARLGDARRGAVAIVDLMR